jgi:acetyltransferase-like isoleucine patch superfamily enzyme
MKYIAILFLNVKRVYERVCMHLMISLFKNHGENVIFFPTNSSFSYQNIVLGNDVYIGPGAIFLSITVISIGNKVMFGPDVKILGGDHNVSEIGRYMYDVKVKLPENDLPVTIEDDVWVGSGAFILKGVTIGRGAVVAAGSIVTKDVEPYSIVAGIPAKKIKMRFCESDLARHINLLK